MQNARRFLLLSCLVLALAALAAGQQTQEKAEEATSPDEPVANPGRPTVSNPATLTPVGYLQFETGILCASHSPRLDSQVSFNEVVKYSVSRWIELLASVQPYARSRGLGQPRDAPGDVDLGIQAVVHHGEGANPTVALSYFARAYAGAAPDLDIASLKDGALLLISADVKGFHYDTNYIVDELVAGSIRRAAFGQTLSVSHPLKGKFGLSGEIWHFTQPFLRSNAVGNLWAVNYNAGKILVIDCGFNRGLTSTSTRWEGFAGFTYLLPHRLPLRWPEHGGHKAAGSN